MKRNIITSLLFLVLISCQEKALEFKLITKEIVSKGFPSDSAETFYNLLKFKSESEKYVFTNVVKFELHNNTKKKYLFFLKDLNLNNIYNLEIIIEDEKGNVLEKQIPLIDPFYSCKLGSLIEKDFYNQKEKELLLKKIGYNPRSEVIDYYNQDIIIYPNERYSFQAVLSLPFIVEDTDENLRRPLYFNLYPEKKYTFQLKYKLKIKNNNDLSKEFMNSLKENNIEIFTGEIKTQKIPILFK